MHKQDIVRISECNLLIVILVYRKFGDKISIRNRTEKQGIKYVL